MGPRQGRRAGLRVHHPVGAVGEARAMHHNVDRPPGPLTTGHPVRRVPHG
jgi:hypothetical protein